MLFWISRIVIVATIGSDKIVHAIRLFNMEGNLLQIKTVERSQKKVIFPASNLPDGIYLVAGEGNNSKESKKVVVTKR